jgi:hypothetical protein
MEKVLCFTLYSVLFLPTVSLAWMATRERPGFAVLIYLVHHFALFYALQSSGWCFLPAHAVPEK